MGYAKVFDLRNGTMGWMMAGLELETGSTRLELPASSPAALAGAEAFAARIAAEDGVRTLSIPALRELMAKGQSENVYLIDVRTSDEYARGYIPGFQWFPGGQAVQRSDDLVAVKNGHVVFACDGRVRATVAASWYRQMGFPNVFVVDGGVPAWGASGQALARSDAPGGRAAMTKASRARCPRATTRPRRRSSSSLPPPSMKGEGTAAPGGDLRRHQP